MSIESSLPVVDLRDARTDRQRFVQTLGEGLSDLGFVAVVGHPIDEALLSRCYAAAARVFALPEPLKREYEDVAAGRQRGYTPFGIEKAKDQNVFDLKEFWQLGRELPDTHPYRLDGRIPENRFPAEVPEFGEVFREYFLRCEEVAQMLLAAIGEYLALPEGTFAALTRDGNTVARVLYYPDTAGSGAAGAVRAAAHEDINLITLLPASTKPGLELLTRDGRWTPAVVPPNTLVVDTGDMMQHLTAGRLPATTHRVVNPEASDGGRYSLPFFVHPHPDAWLTPSDPAFGPPVRAGDMLAERLRAIGVA